MESVNTATGAEAGSKISISYLPEMPKFTVVSAFVAEALPTPENIADGIQENIEDTQGEAAEPEAFAAAEQAAAVLESEPPIEEPATGQEQRPLSQPESIGEAADPVQRTPSRLEKTEVERARERRALIVQYLLEVRRDDSDRLQGIGLQQQIRRVLGFGDQEGPDDFHTLEQMAILTVEQHDPTFQEPDIFTIHPEEVCKAIDRGYLPESVGLILGYQPQPRPTAAKRPVEIRRPATPSPEAGGESVYTMSARTRKAIAASEGQPRRTTTPSTPRPTPEEARTEQIHIEPSDSNSPNRRGIPKRLNDPSQLPPEEVAARYEKSASIAEAATDYSLMAQEVSLLTHEQFMALALTTPSLKRQFASKDEFSPALIEATGLKDRALGTVISFLLQKGHVEKYDDAYGLKLTPQGEKFLQEGIAAARR